MSDTLPPAARPLPPRPNLEFERKRAKQLLRALKRGAPEAIARVAAHRAGPAPAPDEYKLADAQFAIAREYGFRSWPRLVEYFTTLARHERAGTRANRGLDHYESWARTILAEHRDRREWTARELAAFVPRFYGMRVEEVFAETPTLDDARLAVARGERLPSWEALVEHVAASHGVAPLGDDSPDAAARHALGRRDFAAVDQILASHPDLLHATGPDSLIHRFATHEMRVQTAEARELTEWLVARGADPTLALNTMLLGWMGGMRTAQIEYMLARGADPTWIAPNGYSVLEHAIYRYWNGEAVDLIASRAESRKAFWIAAGLGDVGALDRYIDRKGVPTDAARRNRPDFVAIGPHGIGSIPEADDVEIVWEGFFVAAMNQRLGVLDVLLDRGFPIDYAATRRSLFYVAIGNAMTPLVEYLVRHGASLDVKGWRPYMTARESAEELFVMAPENPERRRILELCGGRDPETLLRLQREKRALRPVRLSQGLQWTLALAAEEAARAGVATEPHHLLVAMLRQYKSSCWGMLNRAGADRERLRRALEGRLLAEPDTRPTADAPITAAGSAAFDAAYAEAKARERDLVNEFHLLYALALEDSGVVADLLRAVGTTPAAVREQCVAAM